MFNITANITECQIVRSNMDFVSLSVDADMHGKYAEWNDNILKFNTPTGNGVSALRALGYTGSVEIIDVRPESPKRGKPYFVQEQK